MQALTRLSREMADSATDQAELDTEVVEPDGEEAEPQLDPEGAARGAAALPHAKNSGEPVLRTRSRPVERFDDALRDEVSRMSQLMIDSIGVGLAANQVGVLHRLLVYRVHQQSPVAALVNPEIEWTGEERETLEEGCLSLPNVHADVERAVHIRVRALNEYGDPVVIEASGLEARVIQHEIDHLDGVLVLDRISRSEDKEAVNALREALPTALPAQRRLRSVAHRLSRHLGVRRRRPAAPGRV